MCHGNAASTTPDNHGKGLNHVNKAYLWPMIIRVALFFSIVAINKEMTLDFIGLLAGSHALNTSVAHPTTLGSPY